MALVSDILHILIFIIFFIVIHIIIVHLSNKNFNVTLKQKIVVDDGSAIIKLHSATREELKVAEEAEEQFLIWPKQKIQDYQC